MASLNPMHIRLLARLPNSERARHYWTSFVESTALPIDYEDFEVAELSAPPLDPRARAQADWSAACSDIDSPETGRISLFDAFFQGGDDYARSLVLLHEAVHIRFLRGPLRRNYEALPKVLDSVPTPNMELPESALKDWRCNLAAALGRCVQEIACDKFLCTNYPALKTKYLAERSWYYSKPDAYLGFSVDDKTAAPFEPYLTIYRVLRADVGLIRFRGQVSWLGRF